MGIVQTVQPIYDVSLITIGFESKDNDDYLQQY